jgi:hypothetical protein
VGAAEVAAVVAAEEDGTPVVVAVVAAAAGETPARPDAARSRAADAHGSAAVRPSPVAHALRERPWLAAHGLRARPSHAGRETQRPSRAARAPSNDAGRRSVAMPRRPAALSQPPSTRPTQSS